MAGSRLTALGDSLASQSGRDTRPAPPHNPPRPRPRQSGGHPRGSPEWQRTDVERGAPPPRNVLRRAQVIEEPRALLQTSDPHIPPYPFFVTSDEIIEHMLLFLAIVLVIHLPPVEGIRVPLMQDNGTK